MTVTGRFPWTGPRKPSTIYNTQDKAAPKVSAPSHLETLHQRRTVLQLEALLAERLQELRADPPRGYP